MLTLLAAAAISCPIPQDSRLIYNLAWVDKGRTLRSGAVVIGRRVAENQPGDGKAVLAAYKLLKTKYHVAAVVNLRQESHEDQAAAKALGMHYLYLPIPDGEARTPSQVMTFFTFLAAEQRAKRITLWHCAGGIGRTGVLAGMLRMQQGWSCKAAAEEMFAMGLHHDQAYEDLPALNNFAAALGKPGYYPASWSGNRRPHYDYAAIARTLPKVNP